MHWLGLPLIHRTPLPRLAADLGCGDGNIIPALLQQGWRVLAIDQEPVALQLVETKYGAQSEPAWKLARSL